jgi:site-specific DNA-cytosine methylase
VTSKTRSWKRWGFTARPATTVTGHGIATRHPSGVQRAHFNAIADGSFELREPYTMDTAKLPTFDGISLSRSYAGEAVNITLEEGKILQTFPDDFPLIGKRNRQWETLGNAVPPRLAEHLIKAVL